MLKDGGVYADVDILLETNLDAFVTPSMSFFVPRDIVGDFASNGSFCMWNGLMGSAPGHPIMVRAVEMLLTNIFNRADYFDVERNLCGASGKATEFWKSRILPILSLSGPCMLGVAVNEVLGKRNTLSLHKTGWVDLHTLPPSVRSQVGDVLLLSVSFHLYEPNHKTWPHIHIRQARLTWVHSGFQTSIETS